MAHPARPVLPQLKLVMIYQVYCQGQDIHFIIKIAVVKVVLRLPLNPTQY